MFATILSLGVSWVVFSLGMLAGWFVDRRTGNAGWVDVVWTLSMTVAVGAGICAAIQFGIKVTFEYAALVLFLLALWALRLAGHLVFRSRRIADDPRYRKLREEWGDDAPRMMALVLQMQALLSLPMVFSALIAATGQGTATLGVLVPGVVVAAFGLWVGWKSDRDLTAFKQSSAGVCKQGLWAWSRHPNYVGEILFWLGIALLSIGHGVVGLAAGVGPVAIYLALRFFTGVPLLEQHMLAKHGEAYMAYQAQTPPLFPWPKYLGSNPSGSS